MLINLFVHCVVCRKYLCPPQGRLTEIPRERGVSKALFFEGKYDTKMEFPEGWGVQTKKPSVGGVWIFSGTTHCTLYVLRPWLHDTTKHQLTSKLACLVFPHQVTNNRKKSLF